MNERPHAGIKHRAAARPGSSTIDPDELAGAFAAVLSKDGRAKFLNRRNEKVGEALIMDAALSGLPFFVTVSDQILAADFDDVTTAADAARQLAEAIRAAGSIPVICDSRYPGGLGKRHVVARIPDGETRRRLSTLAEHLGADVRKDIRPPFSPHRWGGRSVVLHPADPLEALVSLVSTRRPGERLRGRARRIAMEGNPKDRSLACAQTTLSLHVNGWSKGAIYEFLLKAEVGAGAKLREKRGSEQREKYFEYVYVSAVEKAQASPTHKSRPEVDAALADIVAVLDGHGLLASQLYVAGRMFVEIARRSGSLKVHPSCRYLGEELGVSWSTANVWCHDLAGLGLIGLVRQAGGIWPQTWGVQGAPHTSPTPPLGEVWGRGAWERGCAAGGSLPPTVVNVPCLEDPSAADVFGPYGWFGTRGLGFPAWHALILVESEAPRLLSITALTDRLGSLADAALDKLENTELIVCAGDTCGRGPATLEEVARTLRTLGSKTRKRARHAAERRRYRAELLKRRRDSADTASPHVGKTRRSGGTA
jgi:hypothetical protein